MCDGERELIECSLHPQVVTRVKTAAPFQQMPPHHILNGGRFSHGQISLVFWARPKDKPPKLANKRFDFYPN